MIWCPISKFKKKKGEKYMLISQQSNIQLTKPNKKTMCDLALLSFK